MANSGVNVKMAVEGVAQFKSSMREAQASVKTLDQALKLNEAQFRETGDAEEYLSNKAGLLKDKMGAQQTVINETKKALETMRTQGISPASSKYQEMQQKMLAAETKMSDMRTELNKTKDGMIDTKSSTEDMNKELQNIGQGVAWGNIADGLGKITAGMEAAAKKAVQLGKQIVNASRDSSQWADDLITRSTQYGVSTEELQKMENVSKFIDTEVDTILAARQRMNKNIGSGNKNALEALGFLGVGTGGKPEDTFWAIGEALMKVTDETEQEAKANAIFGKSWRDLVPLFQAGRSEYEQMMAEQNVLTDDQVQSLGKLDDAYNKVENQINAIKQSFWASLAPALTEATAAFAGLVDKFNAFLQSDAGKEAIPNVVNKITEALGWISEHSSEVVTGLEVIGAAFAALKIAEFAASLMQVVSGFKTIGLVGGGAKAAGAAGGLGTTIPGLGRGAGGAVQTLIKGGGASALVPAGVAAVAVAPAVIAQKYDDDRWIEQQNKRLKKAQEIAEKGDTVTAELIERSAYALGPSQNSKGEYARNFLGFLDMNPNSDAEKILMGLGDRQNLERAKMASVLNGAYTSQGNNTWNELMRLWGGEAMDQARLEAILTSVTEAYERMSTAVDDLSGSAISQGHSNSEMTAAIGDMKGLPAAITAAVQSGMRGIHIYIDGATAGGVLAPHINRRMGGLVAQATR